MADIKTHLRELSVAVTVGLLADGAAFTLNDLYDIDFFFHAAKGTIRTELSSVEICGPGKFAPELCQIIENGYRLGKKIFDSDAFDIPKGVEIRWMGNDTQKDDPIDVQIGQYGFSLKEESFILENMGLYKLLNCFTGSAYKKRHIFKDYALEEYRDWFSVTWNEMRRILDQSGGVWTLQNEKKQKTSRIELGQDHIVLRYLQNGRSMAKSVLPWDCTLDVFERNTSLKTREEVFSKFINQELSGNGAYTQAKKRCAVAATTRLSRELMDNLNYSAGLPRFLRIHSFSYYYAKTTSKELSIYKVPSLEHFQHTIVIESIESSVPDTQANILTTIRNKKTGKRLVLRNECRFSHGQFNGTPEAKMYYEHGGSLLTIYEAI